MKATKALTEAQTALIRDLGLDPATVTFESQIAVLPCLITVLVDGTKVEYWLSRNANGKLRLDEKEGSFHTCLDDELETPDLEKIEGKWRQTGKRSLSDSIPESDYTRDEAEAFLQRKVGLSKPLAKAVVAQVFDGDSIRAAAMKSGVDKHYLAAQKIQLIVKALRARRTLPSESHPTPPPVIKALGTVSFPSRDWNSLYRLRGWTPPSPGLVTTIGSKAIPLCDVKRCANELFKELGGMDKHGPSDYWPTSSQVPPPTPEIARQIVQHIRSSPGVLVSCDGRFYLETLVELLEAANWGVDRTGWCGVAVKKNRKKIAADGLPYMPYVASGWNRKRVAKAARKILEGLWERGAGDSLAIPAEILTDLLDGIMERVAELQAEWKAFSVAGKEVALTGFREAHAEELKDFTEREMRYILNGDLLKVACRLAEREIGVSEETFIRCHRGTLVRLREYPYAEGRLAFKRLLENRSDRKR